MQMFKCAIKILALILLINGSAISATIHVPSVQPTIQQGIDAALEGDTVLVAPGTYAGADNRDLTFSGKNIMLKSESGPEATIIDAEGSEANPHRCFVFINGETNAAQIIGFTIQGGRTVGSGPGLVGNGAGAACISSSPTFTDCIFRLNTSSRHGAAVYCEQGASPDFNDCLFKDNTALENGGAYAAEGALSQIINCTFAGNSAEYSGAIHLGTGSNVMINECLIYDNTVIFNAAAIGLFGSHPTIRNCTIDGNSSDNGAQIWLENGSYPGISNTIIVFGISSRAISCPYGTPTLSCCDVYGNENGDYLGCISGLHGINGNIGEDPLFCDPISGNYFLSAPSPCTAENSSCGLMGAYGLGCADEGVPFAYNIRYGPEADGSVVFTDTPEIYWSYFDTAATIQTMYEIEIGTDDDWSTAEMWDTGPVTSSDSSVLYAGAALEDRQTYYLRIHVNNGSEWGIWTEWSFYTLFNPANFALSQDLFIFEDIAFSAEPIIDTLIILNVGNDPLNWTASWDESWLAVQPSSGTAPDTVEIIASSQYLDNGDYTDQVVLESPDAFNSPALVNIIFHVRSPCQGLCGDANNDGVSGAVSDAVWIINHAFIGGNIPQPVLACGDANSDCSVNVSDAVWMIGYVFIGGPAPGDCCPGGWDGQGGDCCPF